MELGDVPVLMRQGLKLGKDYSAFLDRNRYNKDTVMDTTYRKSLKILQCDQTASSYPLKCIESFLQRYVYPYYSNTHSNNFMGRLMSKYVDVSKDIILESMNADHTMYSLIFTGSGCSGAINHLVHLIKDSLKESVVFASVTEHYSNLLPWYHYAKQLILIDITADGRIDLAALEKGLAAQQSKKKIVSMSACSNVTGVIQPVDKICALAHKYNSYCFLDFAASAPYLPINVNKINADAVFVSPHKFPGAQSSPGILVVRKTIVCNPVTYTPSGGSVTFVCSKSGPIYSSNLEVRETGGTPNILGIVRTGLAFHIKTHFLHEIVTHELALTRHFQHLLKLVAQRHAHFELLNPTTNELRLPIFSFIIHGFHYNFIVALLCDLFGITSRGGVSCSGVFAEKLLHMTDKESLAILESIKKGRGTPPEYGWVRITLTSYHTPKDCEYIAKCIDAVCSHADEYVNDYVFDAQKNVYFSKLCADGVCSKINA